MRIKTLRTLCIFLFMTLIDIPVQGIDIFPDVLGYFGLFVCFTLLIEQERKFVRAQNFALLAFLLSLVLLFKLVDAPQLILTMQMVAAFLDVLLMAYMFSAISALAVRFESRHVVHVADRGFLFYLPVVPLWVITLFMPALVKLVFFVNIMLGFVVLLEAYICYRELLKPMTVEDDFAMEEEIIPPS